MMPCEGWLVEVVGLVVSHIIHIILHDWLHRVYMGLEPHLEKGHVVRQELAQVDVRDGAQHQHVPA